jgi:hypothetical protein
MYGLPAVPDPLIEAVAGLPTLTVVAVGVPKTGCGPCAPVAPVGMPNDKMYGLPEVPEPLIETVGDDPAPRDETVGVPNTD